MSASAGASGPSGASTVNAPGSDVLLVRTDPYPVRLTAIRKPGPAEGVDRHGEVEGESRRLDVGAGVRRTPSTSADTVGRSSAELR